MVALALTYDASVKNLEISRGGSVQFAAARGLRPDDRRTIQRLISAQETLNVHNALVPVAQADPTASLAQMGSRPRADFLAQLIATMEHAPQTRVRRRAEPEEAIAAYSASERQPRVQRHAVSRSL
jgi:hypothetical protein